MIAVDDLIQVKHDGSDIIGSAAADEDEHNPYSPWWCAYIQVGDAIGGVQFGLGNEDNTAETIEYRKVKDAGMLYLFDEAAIEACNDNDILNIGDLRPDIVEAMYDKCQEAENAARHEWVSAMINSRLEGIPDSATFYFVPSNTIYVADGSETDAEVDMLLRRAYTFEQRAYLRTLSKGEYRKLMEDDLFWEWHYNLNNDWLFENMSKGYCTFTQLCNAGTDR